jgi:excisionase family DNA binding protein
MKPEQQLVTANDLARIGFTRGAAYRMAREGRIPHYRIGAKGRGIRFNVAEVLAAIRQPAKTTPGDEAV